MTREELWLAAIAGLDGVNPPDYPAWHYEEMLAAIYDVVTGAATPRAFPARSWKLDEFLYAVYCAAAGLDDPGCPEPTDRIELFWKGIYDGVKGEAGASVPTPVWRIEEFLSAVFTASAGWGERTLTGPIVSFIGRSYTRILECTASIAPIQDLHGYDHPWAAGAGKNLYSPSWAVSSGANSTVTANGGEIHVVTTGGTAYSGMSTSTVHDLPVGTYYVKFKVKTGAITGTGGFCGLRKRSNNTFFTPTNFSSETLSYSFSVTTTEACYFSVLGNGSRTGDSEASDFTLYDLIISTENVDYEPYSNICPITGFTGANAYRTGKNLCYQPFPEYVNYNGTTWKNNEDGSVAVTGTPTAYAYGLVTFNLPAGIYKVSGAPDDSAQGYNDILVQYPAGTIIARDYNGADESVRTFTLSSNSEGVRVLLRAAPNHDTDVTFYPMVTLASEISADYEPYAGDAYLVDWTSAAGTIYAGSYNFVSGKLKSRPYYPSYNGETLVGPWLSSMDVYAAGITPTTGAQVVDFGGTETEYTLTPQTVTALLGQNNVWADTGDVTVTVKGASV